jgi:hypothetical protein
MSPRFEWYERDIDFLAKHDDGKPAVLNPLLPEEAYKDEPQIGVFSGFLYGYLAGTFITGLAMALFM